MDHLRFLLQSAGLSDGEVDDFIPSVNCALSILEDIKHDDKFLTTATDILLVKASNSSASLASIYITWSISAKHHSPLDLVRCYNKVWRSMPEEIKTGRDRAGSALLKSLLKLCMSSYSSILDILPPDSDAPALIDPTTWTALSHHRLAQFIDDFRLPGIKQSSKKPTVAIAMPNGPHLALACLAVSTYLRAAPLNTNGGSVQFRSDVEQVSAKVVLVSKSLVASLGVDDAWYKSAGIQVLIAEELPDLTFEVTPLVEDKNVIESKCQVSKNGPNDIGLILMTSGTSGNKKVVPMTVHSIISGVSMVIDSWGLSSSDCCLNMMPLNHVGGLIRNLFAPIISGGSTICASAFDANLFWDIVEHSAPTWYYASPTMHATILSEATHRPVALQKAHFRLICNAAGGLLPSLAEQLRNTFRCTVLPSYGMTECMPISTPPLSYELERTGTSGVSVGPDIAVFNGSGKYCDVGLVGDIHVRGAPLFPGYLTADDSLDTSAINEAGWFSTGDKGYLDSEGYLYVTGRSKEVINRGGELISPLEIEEGIMKAAQDSKSTIYGRVKDVLAFSTPHDVLQEVAAVVLVVSDNMPRPDLRQLRESLKPLLHQPKWPEIVVYMDNIPKNNGKVLRTRLSERLGLAVLSETTGLCGRHIEAVCPPINTPLDVSISTRRCDIALEKLESLVEEHFEYQVESFIDHNDDDSFNLHLAPSLAPDSFLLKQDTVNDLQASLAAGLHGCQIPLRITFITVPFPLLSTGEVDREKLHELQSMHTPRYSATMRSPVESKLCELFAETLGCRPEDVLEYSDFFNMGGDSLRAGRLLSAIRRELDVRIPIQELFGNSTIAGLCAYINTTKAEIALLDEKIKTDGQDEDAVFPKKLYSSTNPLVMLIQLIPMVVLYPVQRAFQWTVLLYVLSTLLHTWPNDTTTVMRILILVISVAIAKTVTQVVAPLLAVATKWTVIGRYRAGLYPIWGPYHTRWWFVQKALSVATMGIFKHTNTGRVLYYRLLGAKIGKAVNIDKATILGEYDLITIGNDVDLDNCICRPFGAERNTIMYLGAIDIGDGCCVGLKSIVAPGAKLPPNTCIGPNSSSWEMEHASEANRQGMKSRIPQPALLWTILVGWPIIACIHFVSFLPRAAALYGLVDSSPGETGNWVEATIIWFAQPTRVGWHFVAYILDMTAGTAIYFLLIVCMKRSLDFLFGKLQAGPAAQRTEFMKLRMWLMETLIPDGNLGKFTEFFGLHYEVTSWLIRALGGKVGKRVYWPGTGPSIQDFDLLDIGDDVVFGSRSYIVTSDGLGSHHVRVGAGSMIADRVVLLPGTTTGTNVVMGSGALSKRNGFYPSDTIWIGSKNGEAVSLSATTEAPAGKPLYKNVAWTTRRNSATTLTSHGSERLRPPHSRQNSEITCVNDDNNRAWSRSQSAFSTRHNSTISLSMKSPPNLNNFVLTDFNEKKDCGLTTIYSLDPVSEYESNKHEIQAEGESSSPFGRAFYEGKANYHVLSLITITLYSTLIKLFVSVYWNATTVSTVQILDLILRKAPMAYAHSARPLVIFGIATVSMSTLLTAQAVLAMMIIVVAKWALMGRRRPGSYNWDESSYCQRWQILLSIEKIRRACYGGVGVVGLLTSTQYLVWYFRALGAKIGPNCSLFAGGRPSLLFTEPDLLDVGERTAVDDASLVAHVNSRGNFSLNELKVGRGCVLRSGSRLLSGGVVEEGGVLLEHTLVVGGGVVERKGVYQGWPAEYFQGPRL